MRPLAWTASLAASKLQAPSPPTSRPPQTLCSKRDNFIKHYFFLSHYKPAPDGIREFSESVVAEVTERVGEDDHGRHVDPVGGANLAPATDVLQWELGTGHYPLGWVSFDLTLWVTINLQGFLSPRATIIRYSASEYSTGGGWKLSNSVVEFMAWPNYA